MSRNASIADVGGPSEKLSADRSLMTSSDTSPPGFIRRARVIPRHALKKDVMTK